MKGLLRSLLLTAILWCSSIPVAGLAGQSNSLMDISTDGRLLACSNRDSNTVTIVDLATLKVRHEVAVGKKPEGVTFLGKTHRLAVAVYASDQVVLVDDASRDHTIAIARAVEDVRVRIVAHKAPNLKQHRTESLQILKLRA